MTKAYQLNSQWAEVGGPQVAWINGEQLSTPVDLFLL